MRRGPLSETTMPRSPLTRRRAGVLAAATALVALGACADDAELRVNAPAGNAAFMDRYVALGNSITAGYQSGGINDSTQRRAYPALIARAAGVRYEYAALQGAQCAPAADLFSALSGARTVPPGQLPCSRLAGHETSTLNNVAVPGANSFDPTGGAGGGYNALTGFVLGGRTQVQKALDLDPTFASIWIGNNDVLSFAINGTTTGITPQATFEQNYGAMLTQLTTGRPSMRGLLIGVVNVSNTPILFPAAVLASPQVRGAINQVANQPVTIDANCTGSASRISFGLLLRIRTGAHPAYIGCEKNTIPGTPVGDAGVLDAAEQATFAAAVAGYNAYIQQRATALNWAYYDPNPALQNLVQTGQIPPFPALQSAQPFGTYFSLDGVHPANAAHLLLAQQMVAAINTKYQTNIPAPTAVP